LIEVAIGGKMVLSRAEPLMSAQRWPPLVETNGATNTMTDEGAR